MSLELLTKRGDGGDGDGGGGGVDDCDRHRMNTERVPFVLMPSYSCCSDDTPGAARLLKAMIWNLSSDE